MSSHSEEQIICQALWAVLFGGRDLPFGRLTALLPDVCDLHERLERLADKGVLEVDWYGQRVYGVCGITLTATDHRIRIGRSWVYARTLGEGMRILADLGETGSVESLCSRCGARVSIRFRKGKVSRIRHRFRLRPCGFRARDTEAVLKMPAPWEAQTRCSAGRPASTRSKPALALRSRRPEI